MDKEVSAALDDMRDKVESLKVYVSDFATQRQHEAARITNSYLGLTFLSGILSFATPPTDLPLVNGANEDVALPGCALIYEISGPTAAFSIGGFSGCGPGRVIFLFNNVAQQMTITNNSGGSLAANRLSTLTGANVVLRAGKSFAIFMYSLANSLWTLCASN